jgi:hypothetical protein
VNHSTGDGSRSLGAGAERATVDCYHMFGYDVSDIGEGERILPAAIVERFVAGADGGLEPLIAASTRPLASTVTHAGICQVRRHAFGMP